MASTIEEEDKVMATAKKIVESLNTSKEDMIMIFARFDNRLSNITSLISGADGGDCKKGADDDDDDPLVAAEKVILRWDSEVSESSRLWEESPNEAAEYLAAVDELLKLTEDSSDEDEIEDRDRAEIAIQLAMSRLEDEFRHILIRNTVPLNADRLYGSIRRVSLSFASHDGEIEDFESFGEEIEGYCHERGASLGDDLCVDLVHLDAVVELKEIADRMTRVSMRKSVVERIAV